MIVLVTSSKLEGSSFAISETRKTTWLHTQPWLSYVAVVIIGITMITLWTMRQNA